jgi:Ca2+-binding EF-hand superfamily protein
MKHSIWLLGLSAAAVAGTATMAPAHGVKWGRDHGQRPGFEELDANADGLITPEEIAAHRQVRFDAADTDKDGLLSAEELEARMAARLTERVARMIGRKDTDGDGRLSRDELSARPAEAMFARADSDGDGAVSVDEFEAMKQQRGRGHGMMRRHPDGE